MNELKKELEPYKKQENDKKRGYREYLRLDSLNHRLTCYVLQLNTTPDVGKFLEILHQGNQLEFKKLISEHRVNNLCEAFEIDEQQLEDKIFKLSLFLKLGGANSKGIEKFFEVDDLSL